MSANVADALTQAVAAAAEEGVRKALSVNEATNRRLLSIEEAATYLDSNTRTIHEMIRDGEIDSVPHGARRKLDIRDLDNWIAGQKLKAKRGVA